MAGITIGNWEISTYSQPLSADQRGLIVSNQISKKVFNGNPLEPEILRMLTLFFDVIDIPRGPEDLFFHSDYGRRGKGRNVDEQFLIETEFITRTIRLPKQQEGHSLNVGRGEYFGSDILQAREIVEPGRWAIATVRGGKPSFRPDAFLGRGISFEIYDALPIPEKNIPLEDCLNFRRKYVSELQELRYHIESVSQNIRNSTDYNLANISEIENVIRSAKNYIQAMKGAGIRHTVNNLSFDITAVGTAAGLASLDPQNGAVYFGSMAAAKVIYNAFQKTSPNPFSYLWSAERHL